MTDPRGPAEIAEALEARARETEGLARALGEFRAAKSFSDPEPPGAGNSPTDAALDRAAAAKLREMELALKPFAGFVDALESLGGPSRLTEDDSVFYSISNRDGDNALTLGQFRAARAALSQAKGQE